MDQQDNRITPTVEEFSDENRLYTRSVVTFTPQAPGFDLRGQLQLEQISKCLGGDAIEIFNKAIRTDFQSKAESDAHFKVVDDRLFRTFRGPKDKLTGLDQSGFTELEKLYYKILTETNLKPHHISGLIGKHYYFEHVKKFTPQGKCAIVVYALKHDAGLLMPSRVVLEPIATTPKPQDPTKPSDSAGDPIFTGGMNGAGLAQEEILYLQTELPKCPLDLLPKGNPLYVEYVADPDGKNTHIGLFGTNFETDCAIIVLDKTTEMSGSIYGKPLYFAHAQTNESIMSQLVTPIDPHPQWIVNWAMPDLRERVLTKDLIRQTLQMMFRATCLNLVALLDNNIFSDSDTYQMVMRGTGIFAWLKELVALMLQIAASMAAQATQIRKFKPVIAAFNEAQEKEVVYALTFGKYFDGLETEEVIDRLESFYKVLKFRDEMKRANVGQNSVYEIVFTSEHGVGFGIQLGNANQ